MSYVGLPSFLLTEVRLAFRSCAKQRVSTGYRTLSSSPSSCRRASPASPSQRKSHLAEPRNANTKLPPQRRIPVEDRGLVVQEEEKSKLSRQHRGEVPLKVIPQAKLSSTVELSPQQRLHIEALTRRAPKISKEKQIYKEKLLIYHFGTGGEKFLILLKFVAIFSAGFVLAIVAPAHYHAGTSPWLIVLFVTGGLLPIAVIHALTRSWVTRIFLHLPPHARQTPKAAMDFARNLPANARLDIEYLRPVPLASKITANVVDLTPARYTWMMTTFQWTGPRAEIGTFWRPKLAQFYVKPESSKGRAARFTIPGIWTNVYRRLAGIESEAASKWRAPG